MKTLAFALSALTLLTVTAACSTEGDAGSEGASASAQAVSRKGCGVRTSTTTPISLASVLDDVESLKLVTKAGGVPVGARNRRFFTSLTFKDGKFKATFNDKKKLSGEYSLSGPRCPSNFEILTLGDDESEQLVFKIYRGKVSPDGETLPSRTYAFVAQGDGFIPFNMEVDGWEEREPAPEADEGCRADADCADLPKPRCFGAYVCESNDEGNGKSCVWRSPVGGPKCAPP